MNREQWLRTKDLVLAGAAAAGSAAVNALGGWDRALQTLLFCMALDYLTGLVVAGVFGGLIGVSVPVNVLSVALTVLLGMPGVFLVMLLHILL